METWQRWKQRTFVGEGLKITKLIPRLKPTPTSMEVVSSENISQRRMSKELRKFLKNADVQETLSEENAECLKKIQQSLKKK